MFLWLAALPPPGVLPVLEVVALLMDFGRILGSAGSPVRLCPTSRHKEGGAKVVKDRGSRTKEGFEGVGRRQTKGQDRSATSFTRAVRGSVSMVGCLWPGQQLQSGGVDIGCARCWQITQWVC